MGKDYFQHPNRMPQNVAGPFYGIGHLSRVEDSVNPPKRIYSDCLECDAPQNEAPGLIAQLGESNRDTYFIKQPETADEIEQAILALQVCCTCALRYGGKNVHIIHKLGNHPNYCDYVLSKDEELLLTVDEDGELLPFAEKNAKVHKKWWQFWR